MDSTNDQKVFDGAALRKLRGEESHWSLSHRIFHRYGVRLSPHKLQDWEEGRSQPMLSSWLALIKFYGLEQQDAPLLTGPLAESLRANLARLMQDDL
jgi:hypothetical protein